MWGLTGSIWEFSSAFAHAVAEIIMLNSQVKVWNLFWIHYLHKRLQNMVTQGEKVFNINSDV